MDTYDYSYRRPEEIKKIHLFSLLVGISEGVLCTRFILKLIGADVGNSFIQFIYFLSYPLVEPFLYQISSFRIQDIVIEWSTLIAIATYLMLAWCIKKIGYYITNSPRKKLQLTPSLH